MLARCLIFDSTANSLTVHNNGVSGITNWRLVSCPFNTILVDRSFFRDR